LLFFGYALFRFFQRQSPSSRLWLGSLSVFVSLVAGGMLAKSFYLYLGTLGGEIGWFEFVLLRIVGGMILSAYLLLLFISVYLEMPEEVVPYSTSSLN